MRYALFPMLFALGCGGPQSSRTAGDDELRSLTETRALTLVAEAMTDGGVSRGARFAVSIAPEESLEVDVRLADTRFGIEWVSAQDRLDHGDAIPEPASGGELQILPGRGDDENIEVLILDAQRYRYDPRQERVYSGSASPSEVEARLRRDVQDFLEYCRGQL
ncbi:MAG: hypothetical protein AAGE52_04710 [Myxococcota bacterium]